MNAMAALALCKNIRAAYGYDYTILNRRVGAQRFILVADRAATSDDVPVHAADILRAIVLMINTSPHIRNQFTAMMNDEFMGEVAGGLNVVLAPRSHLNIAHLRLDLLGARFMPVGTTELRVFFDTTSSRADAITDLVAHLGHANSYKLGKTGGPRVPTPPIGL